jgi:chromosome segregation ATPase
MSFWELFNLRNQNFAQQNQIHGLRGNAILDEAAAATALVTAETLRRDLAARDRRLDDARRKLDRNDDELDEAMRALRALRQQYRDVAEANAKLLRERHVLKQMAVDYADWMAAHHRIFNRLRDHFGADPVAQALGGEHGQCLDETKQALETDAAWMERRDQAIVRDAAAYMRALDLIPASAAP